MTFEQRVRGAEFRQYLFVGHVGNLSKFNLRRARALIGRRPGSIKHRKIHCPALEAEGWPAYKARRPAASNRIHNRFSRAASNGVLMKSLLKFLVVAAALGLAPAAAMAQP